MNHKKLKQVIGVVVRCMESKTARRMVYGLFIVQAVFLIFTIRIGVPPDELTHIRFIEHYVNQPTLSPFISEQTEAFYLGDTTREISYLYHYAMSLVMRALPLPDLALYIVLRFISLAVVLATLVVSARIMKQLGASASTITIGLLAVTNIAQFLFMSAAINNDQITWLATAVGFWCIVRMWRRIQLADALVLLNVILFTSLVKKTFLPIAVVFGITLLVVVARDRQALKQQVAGALRRRQSMVLVLGLTVLAVLGGGLVVERVVPNVIQYQQLDVVCSQIHTSEQCSEYGVFRRNERLLRDKPADFSPTVLPEFARHWYPGNFKGIFGTQGWNGRAMPDQWAFVAFMIITTASLVVGGAYSVRKWRSPGSFVFMVGFGYILVQLLVNYNVYLRYSVQGLALQGRYIFPIFVPLILVVVYIWSKVLRKQPVVTASLAIVVVTLLILQSGLSVILRSGIYTDALLRPVILFDQENAISPFEPSV